MKTIILISALAAVALAAPFLGDEQFKSDTTQETSLSIIEREKKSPIITPHIKPLFSEKKQFFVNKPIIIKKKLGYHLLRSSDEEQSNSQEKCAKQIKVKLCDLESMPNAKEAMKNTHIEDMNVRLVGDDMEHSIKLAKEAVENLQRDLQQMGRTSKVESPQANWNSNAGLHEDIETARQALEHVQNNFGNLESFSLVAPVTEDLMKQDNLKSLTEEDEKLAQWHAAVDNIQKNVAIASNIEESLKFASAPQLKGLVIGSETKNDPSKDISTYIQDEKQMRISHEDNVHNVKSELSHKTNEEGKDSKDTAATKAKAVENINEEENEMKTSATEPKKTQVSLVNTFKEADSVKLDIDTMDKMSEKDRVDHMLKLTNKQILKNSEQDQGAAPKFWERDHVDEVKSKKGDDGQEKNKSVKSEEKTAKSEIFKSDEIDKLIKDKEVVDVSKPILEKMSIKQESTFNEVPLIEKAAISKTKNRMLETETKEEISKDKENQMLLVKDTKTDTQKESSILKSVQNLEELKPENILETRKEMSEIKLPKPVVETDVKESSQSNKHISNENSENPTSHHHHHHHHHATLEINEKNIGPEVKALEKKENQVPIESTIKTEVNSAAKENAMLERHKKLVDSKHGSLIENKLDHPEKISFKSAYTSKLQDLGQQEKHMSMAKSADAESTEMKPTHHHHGLLHQKSTDPQLHEPTQFHQSHHMNADSHRMMKTNSHFPTSFDAMGHARNTHFSGHSQMPERGFHASGRTSMMSHGMDSAMQPSMQMNSIMDPTSKSAMEHNMMQWKHEGKSASYGAPEPGSGSGGAVGLFPNANVGNCAIPLLLSCNPSVVSGSLAKSHSFYSAPSYKAGNDFNYLKKRDVKVTSADNQIPSAKLRTSTLFKNTPIKNKPL